MRSLEAVRTELLAPLTPLPSEIVPLAEASGRVVAEAPHATTDVPPADNVAMDGYAVRAADLVEVPRRLEVVGRVAPGEHFVKAIQTGQAVRVFTGAPLPPGADAVLMQEDTVVSETPGTIVAQDKVKPWENVRFRGEDVSAKSPLVGAGIRLGPAQLGLLGAAGVSSIRVYRRPRIGILITGSELVPPGQPLQPGQIYESNGIMLAELIRSVGAEVVQFPTVRDQPELLEASLRHAWPSVDLLVTSGGASVGEPDLVRSCIAQLGATVWDGEVSLKPGKPFFSAGWNGRRLTGLPGNPVSAFVTAVLLVLPAVRRLQGLAAEGPPTTPGILTETMTNGDSRRHFVRVATDSAGHVRSSGVQASHRLSSLSSADGLVEVPPKSTLAAGTTISVIRW
ncbi:MAG TPA: molybdopterin molybdotransferase MoeA [Verrucomicrobiota bacterium]|nr:molybdopterin molybdenumtransferase MoeA [Verrucomicrobiales bacterium]HRI15277.1 molybdopterin molybdotransferase MoeA [Verrucomicrobiota bacterium]